MSGMLQMYCHLSTDEKRSVSWPFSETYGVISYGSGWRKDVVNQCLERTDLGKCTHQCDETQGNNSTQTPSKIKCLVSAWSLWSAKSRKNISCCLYSEIQSQDHLLRWAVFFPFLFHSFACSPYVHRGWLFVRSFVVITSVNVCRTARKRNQLSASIPSLEHLFNICPISFNLTRQQDNYDPHLTHEPLSLLV